MNGAVKDIPSLHQTVNVSKYTPPQLPRIFRRSRLLDLIESQAERRLIVIVGQPAQGKTTLAADYLLHGARPAIWLHLDAEDGAATNFLLLLRSAAARLAQGETGKEAGDVELVSLSIPHSTDRFKARLHALFRQLPPLVDIILDGIDQLPSQAPAFRLINALIDQATADNRVFLISRKMPPLPLQPLMVNQQVAVIDNEALAFTQAEIEGYFGHIHNAVLPPKTIRHLRQVTGGWPGGLAIVSQSIGQLPQNRWVDFLHKALKGRFSGQAFNYFSQEVFIGQPENVQQFLMRSALLDVLDPDAVAVVTDPLPSHRLLQDLVQRNIFIETLYDECFGTTYRYNPLFRQFLRTMGQTELTTAEREKCLVQAGDHYRNKQGYETAVRYFLQAKSFERAAEGIKKLGVDLVITGRLTDLANMIDAIPQQQVETDPWLKLYRTLARRLKDGRQYIGDLARVLGQFEASGAIRGRLLALAFLIEAHIFLGYPMVGRTDYLSQGERFLKSLGDVSYFAYAKALLWLQIGFGRIVGGFDPARGIAAARNAASLALGMEERAMQVNAGIICALGYTMTGDFERADQALSVLRQLVSTTPYPEYKALQRLVKLQLDLQRGDFDSVDNGRESLRHDIESFGMLFFYPAYVEAMGFLHLYQGRFDDARAAARHLEDLATMAGNNLYHGLAARLYGAAHYFAGNFFDARAAALKALALVDARDTLYGMQASLLAGLTHIHLGDHGKAQIELDAVLVHAVRTENAMARCEAHFALALLAHRKNDLPRRDAHLVQACDIATRQAYGHMVVLRPRDLVELSAVAQGHWPPSLLGGPLPPPARTGPSAPPAPPPAPAARVKPRTESPEILTIQTFSGLQLKLGDRPFGAGKNITGKPKVLLMAIVSRGLRDIPKDVLMDDLWPDSPEAAAKKNFKVTLHRLRKAIASPRDQGGGPEYIHQRDNRLSLDPDCCRVDVEDFLNACKDIRRLLAGGSTERLTVLGQRIMTVYRGDFLPEDLYTPWIDMKRLALRDEFIQTLLSLAEHHRQRSQDAEAIACCQAIVHVDPCQEGPAMALMRIYTRQNRQDLAEQAYRTLQTHLHRQLNETPSPEVTRRYREIRNRSL